MFLNIRAYCSIFYSIFVISLAKSNRYKKIIQEVNGHLLIILLKVSDFAILAKEFLEKSYHLLFMKQNLGGWIWQIIVPELIF